MGRLTLKEIRTIPLTKIASAHHTPGVSTVTPGQALDELLNARRTIADPRYQLALRRYYTEEIRPTLDPTGEGGLEDEEYYMALVGGIPDFLGVCEPVLWRDRLWDLSVDAGETYPWQGARFDVSAFEPTCQYWAFENALRNQEDGDVTGIAATALGIFAPGVDGLTADDPIWEGRSERYRRGAVVTITFAVWRERFLFPMIHTYGLHDELTLATGIIAAHLDFLRSKVVEHGSERVQRAFRRRWERETGRDDAPNVRVVRLRKGERDHRDASGDPVEWHHRWLVKGHWRAQRVGPGLSEVRPTFVSAHLKGPEDKPLLAQASRVFHVDR